MPLFVGRPCSIRAVEESAAADFGAAADGGRLVLAATQRRPETAEPGIRDLHETGTLLRILQLFRLPDGSLRILVEGLARVRLTGGQEWAGGLASEFRVLDPAGGQPLPAPALAAEVRRAFLRYVRRHRRVAPEVALAIRGVEDPGILSLKVAAHIHTAVAEKQRLLACETSGERLEALRRLLLEDQQRCAREEAAGAAAQEDGRSEPLLDEEREELEELAASIAEAQMPAAIEERALRELARLGRMAPISPEATVSRSYLDWLIQLPWHHATRDTRDLARAARILDQDHFGLSKVKERILELIAVIKLAGEVRGPILCLSGPPGVGKTSLGRSIARALGREFVRMSLGGVRDESEIRGHRRTYVGSLPGRILQAMRRAGSVNPVILLDEIDKIGSDHRGDPAAALLEVLDPEQNVAFTDHYLEVDYDLSRVLFITTANQLHAIPEPLRDRMEIIRLPGYTELEKIEIARRFLLPRQRRANGLVDGDLTLEEEAYRALVHGYTREAGVRQLEREIARLCRRAAKVKAGGEDALLSLPAAGARKGRRRTLGLTIGPERLRGLLGVPRHAIQLLQAGNRIGLATGLAWTASGGDLLQIEVGAYPGRGTLLLTGQLGETMRESAQAALSYVRSRQEELGLDPRFHRRTDLHVHVPEGAVPKDGPSAGVTIALALVSALTGRATRADVALTGEITLRGAVLAVGGLNEKILAARRAGLATVLIPAANAKHLGEMPAEIRAGLDVRPVATMDEVLAVGLLEPARPERAPARILPLAV